MRQKSNTYYKKRLDYYLNSAKQGLGYDFYLVGEMYKNGMGVRKDLQQGQEYYNEYFEYCKSLAEMGDNHAINRLGLIYSEGIGVEVDRTKAAEWYLKAADEGCTGGLSTTSP